MLSQPDISMKIGHVYAVCRKELVTKSNDGVSVKDMLAHVEANIHVFNDRIQDPVFKVVKKEWEKNERKPVYALMTLSYYDFMDTSRALVDKMIFMNKEYFGVASEGAFVSYGKKLVRATIGETVYGYCAFMVLLSPVGDVKRFCSVIQENACSATRLNKEDMIRYVKKGLPKDTSVPDEVIDILATEEWMNNFNQVVAVDEATLYKAQTDAMMALRTCAHCKTRTLKLPCCPCKEAYYCTKKCQKEHWKEHKKTCTKFIH